MGDVQLPALLAKFSLFHDFSIEELERVAPAVRERSYAKGATIFHKGDQPTGLFLVLAGQVKEVCQSAAGGEKIIELVGANRSFGESALFLDCPQPYSAAALADTRLLHVDKAACFELIARQPRFVLRMVKLLSKRTFARMRDIEATGEKHIQRVARYLGGRCSAAGDITLPATKQAVASLLGMTPETFSRNLRDLADSGLIDVHGSQVDVFDLDRLKTFYS